MMFHVMSKFEIPNFKSIKKYLLSAIHSEMITENKISVRFFDKGKIQIHNIDACIFKFYHNYVYYK